MERVVIDTIWTRAVHSSSYVQAKGMPVKTKWWITEIYYWVEDIEQSDFNKDYDFSVSWTNNNFKLLYITNTKEYFTTLKRQISRNNFKEYTISSFSLEWFKEKLGNFLITNGILMD